MGKISRFLLPASCLSLMVMCGPERGSEEARSARLLEDGGEGWKVIGPGGGGAQYIPTISPGDPDNVFVRCDMTGSYVTQNGGRSWRMFNLRTVVRDFEFDPLDPDTVYACNTGLYRSEDRGGRWKLIFPAPQDVMEEVMHGDHASQNFVTTSGMPPSSIAVVRVDPGNNDHIYLGLSRAWRSDGPLKILESTDKGANFRELADVKGGQILGIFPGSWEGKSGELTVVTDTSCVKISRSDGSVTEFELPVSRALSADGGSGSEGTRLYLLSQMSRGVDGITGGVYCSSDMGETWVKMNGQLEEGLIKHGRAPGFRSFAVCEGQPEVVYLSCSENWVEEMGLPQRYSGIMKTTDGGESWDWVLTICGGDILTQNFRGGWLRRDLGWFSSPSYLGVCPTNSKIVYGTDSGRTFKSEDGGANWEQLISQEFADGSFTTRGLDVTTTYGVHFDPFNEKHIFITYTDIGLFHSYDGGKTWHHSITGIPRQWRNTCYWLEFDPAVRGRIYSVWSNVHDLPRPKMYRSGNLTNGRQEGGVAVSGDGGRWWGLLGKGVMKEDGTHHKGIRPGAVCTHIVMDPDSPVDSRTLYVCDYGYGVWKTSDGGVTWELKNQGLSDQNLYCWRITRLPSGRLILLVARGGVEGQEMIPGAIYSSDDGAETWSQVQLPAGVTAPNDLVYDPSDPDRLYLSCWPLFKEGKEVGGGLYRSEDGGMSWKQVFDEKVHVYAAAVDPNQTDRVFINTFHSAAFRSDNRGEDWSRLEGYNFKWGHRPVVDIHNDGWLYLTTFGGSVYHGPAEGVPGAFEDIENLPGQEFARVQDGKVKTSGP